MNRDFEPECAQAPMAAITPPISVPITRGTTLSFGVIGVGAVGSILAAARRQAGHSLMGVTARSTDSRERAAAMLPGVQFVSPRELCAQVDLLVFTVRGTGLAGLVENLASQRISRTGQLVTHTVGAFGLGVLSPAARSGAIPLALHPAQTFSGTSSDLARLHGYFWTANAPLALLPVAQVLVLDIGGIPRVSTNGTHPLYHAALAHGANHLTTLVTQTPWALQVAGIGDSASFAQPLVKVALERALRGREAGLSGPISRGDTPTIAKHLRALENGQWYDSEDLDPALPRDDLADLPSTYRALAAATAARILNRGGINKLQYKQIEGILGNYAPTRQER